MTKLMEVGFYFVECQQRRLGWGWLCKVGNHGSCWELSLAINNAALLQAKLSCVSVLAISWVQIQVKVANKVASLGVKYLVLRDIRVPHMSLVFRHQHEFQAKEILVHRQEPRGHFVKREVLLDFLFVNLVLLLQQKLVIESPVPEVDFAVERLPLLLLVLSLHFEQHSKFLVSWSVQFLIQIVQEVHDCLRVLGHSLLKDVGSMVLVPKQGSFLLSQLNDLLQDGCVLFDASAAVGEI
mmetsp:Transcript_22255/g.31034  ORF Transcript_22255/g.31034 Transcript_22255/m.31034 type:complete len:239 (+) Transcript_22255:676-1392(+)